MKVFCQKYNFFALAKKKNVSARCARRARCTLIGLIRLISLIGDLIENLFFFQKIAPNRSAKALNSSK